ncbi:His/Glu/Gln/Arg/opine family amino acid ABC transporter permease subunit [Bradyrhizobium japonicum]|uniref:His/Glu/Gln/Arg/opine family amino acid ABC transporter permease subunit n=2 Tax=Bradyrhizobium elkanii TaxID=29448 RepID=A0ABV4EV07_BRAEL|nr:general L-amino acid transport system permease protein [Bradyrhizobium elkanii]UQD79620.1 ABC transporter permease subunit [Bradyrhizobium elkanii USDA 76]MCP1729283.1 general L-amino acid transport system permease protein [Bradyrhizobium elkanii]MCP1756017.1 general L-amino acid transport system permease protein [Bradyrhizobium elkanii]MCP1981532.1 general L-amino acid transport system permease protein [Bradyrhizobium elkanii]
MTTSTPKRPPARPWRLSLSDPRVAGLFWQILVVAIAVAVVAWLWSNAVHNLSVRRISTGFAFLGREAGMPIADSWIDYTPKNTYLRAFIVGVVNTLRVAVIGIVLATVIGTLVGIARLSSNWLLARLAAVYVEVLRDLPLLLQLLFWYVLMQGLPAARQAWKPVDGVYLSNRGLVLPSVPLHEANGWTLVALVVGVIVFIIVRRRLIAQQMLDGKARPAWPYALGLIIALPALVSWLLGASWSVMLPELRGFNFVGGLTLAPEYFALLIALVTYTSAFIAEIVRSGIQAVPRGQSDAAKALGLKRSFVLQHIVLPQALRVIIPPMTSQYLNLTKNSSLAVAVGYQDIVSIANTTLNQTGQAIESIALIMMVFLTISLGISLFMNWYNARIALVER